MAQREVRFGIERSGKHSQYWKLRAAASRGDVYLSSQRTGATLHISLHESAEHWHVKATVRGIETERRWNRPREIAPGVTRAVQLVLTPAAARYPQPKRADKVMWVGGTGDEEWACFNVFIEAPSAGDDWPSRLVPWGTELGRLPTGDGGGVRVIGWTRRGHDGQLTFHPPPDEVAKVREAVAKGGVWGLILGHNADGSLAVFELTTAR